MAYYNQGRYSSPADYFNEQQQKQRSNIQNVLNMVMMMKQFKINQAEKQKEQERYSKEYSDKMTQQQRTYDLSLRKQDVTEEYNQKLYAKWEETTPEEKSAFREKYDQLISLGYPEKQAVEMSMNWKPPSKPTEKATPLRKTPEYKMERQWDRDESLLSDTIRRHEDAIELFSKQLESVGETLVMLVPEGRNQKKLLEWHTKNPNYQKAIDRKSELESSIQNIGESLNSVRGYYSTLHSSSNPLDKVSRSDLNRRYSGFNKVVKGEYRAEDSSGFKIGETRKAKDGRMYKYIGNNQWELIK